MAAHGAAADLLGLGEHCSAPDCAQLDFLPFVCDCCSRTFCLEHRSYAAHACVSAAGRSTEVIVCPLCAKGVRLQGRDANEVFEEHQREGSCDANNWKRVNSKPRCPVKGCKERLSTINTYGCRRCSQRVCLKHRDPEDHSCVQAQASAAAAAQAARKPATGAAAAASSFFSQLTGALGTGGSSSASRPSSAPPPSHAPAQKVALGPQASGLGGVQQYRQAGPTQVGQSVSSSGAHQVGSSNTVQGTADRRRPPPPSGGHQVEALNPLHSQAQAQAPTQGLPELCPQCGARFATVERLVQHVEDFHPPQHQHSQPAPSTTTTSAPPPPPPLRPAPAPTPSASGTSTSYGRRLGSAGDEASPYRCPHCERGFSDPAVLVAHAEACPAARARGVAAGGAGGAKSDCCVM